MAREKYSLATVSSRLMDKIDYPCFSPCGNADPVPPRKVGHGAIICYSSGAGIETAAKPTQAPHVSQLAESAQKRHCDVSSAPIDVRTVLDTADIEHPVVLDCAERDAVVAAARHTPAFEFEP
jgi:hypothetical protein